VEGLVAIVGALLEFSFWLMIHLLYSVCQAVAGVIYPSDNPVIVRRQRALAFLLVAGSGLLGFGIVRAIWFAGDYLALGSAALGVVVLFAAGLLGLIVEGQADWESPPPRRNPNQPSAPVFVPSEKGSP
jgi:hypothetical protein